MTGDGDKYGPVGDDPKLDEKPLSHLVVTSGFFALLGVLYLAWWVFFDTSGNPRIMQQRATAAAPFILAIGAVVTYFTVLWRGAINKSEVDQLRRQNESSDRAELGLLLDKASVYLQSPEEDRLQVGLSMLETVILAPDATYSVPALDILLSRYVGFANQKRQFYYTANRVVSAASNKNRRGTNGNEYRFNNGRVDHTHPVITLPPGFPDAHIWHARLAAPCINSFTGTWRSEGASQDHPAIFYECLIEGIVGVQSASQISLTQTFRVCRFKDCHITRVSAYVVNCVFSTCNFSGASIKLAKLRALNASEFEGCYYHPDHPPVFEGPTLSFSDHEPLKNEFLAKLWQNDRADT